MLYKHKETLEEYSLKEVITGPLKKQIVGRKHFTVFLWRWGDTRRHIHLQKLNGIELSILVGLKKTPLSSPTNLTNCVLMYRQRVSNTAKGPHNA